jgi:hypothetical protein
MKRSTLFTIALVFVFCFLSAKAIKAQAVSGYTSIDYFEATNTVDAYSETDADFDLQGDYDAKVVMEIMDQNNNVVNNHVYSDQSNTGIAFVDVQFSGTSGYTYTAIAHHWAVANLWDYAEFYPYQTVWYDDFYLGYFTEIGINERWYYYFLSPGFQQMERNAPNIDLGGTYDSATTSLNDVPIRFTKAVQEYGSATFESPVIAGSQTATLNLPSDSPPCTGHGFSVKVYFIKPNSVTLAGNSDPRNAVNVPRDSQYEVDGGLDPENVTTTSPDLWIHLLRNAPSNPNHYFSVSVGGSSSISGSSTAGATVTINCN